MKKIIETFNNSNYWLESLATETVPSVFNGVVSVEKYKITKELIEEPLEVLQERLQNLWDNNKNYHNREPLLNKAKEINYKFK